jgi:hypothetical protein
MKGSYSSIKRSSAISEQLNIVEVKCNVVDEKIDKVLRFMCTFNIRKLTNDTFHALYILKINLICGKETKKASGEEENYLIC